MKRILGFVLGFIMVLSLCACYLNPREENVINNGNGSLEKELLKKNTESPAVASENSWQEELQSKDGAVRIHVNASVNWPDKEQLPVVRVQPHAFTIDEVEKIVDALFGDTPLYSDDYYLKKDELEKEIISWKADLESLKSTGKWSGITRDESMRGELEPTETLKDNIEWVEMMLKKAEEAYENAPETIPEVKELAYKEGNGMKTIALRDDQQIPASIGVSVIEGTENPVDSYLEYRNWKGAEYRAASVLNDLDEIEIRTGRDEAAAVASDFIKSIGLDCSLTSVKSVRDGSQLAYVFIFSRNINGMTCLYTETNSAATSNAQHREPWPEERIEVMVNDDGVIGFEWQSPPELFETVNSNVAIKSYDDVIEIARTILPMQFEKEALSKEQRDVAIDEVTLSLMRVAKMGTNDEYYYLPVWDFIGYYGKSANSDISEDNPHEVKSFLTLNAIDGSVIDRGLGY